MSRWENEDVSELNLPEPDLLKKTLYDKAGKVIQDDKRAFAMKVESGPSSKFYIRFNRGEIADPHSIDYNTKTKMFKFKKVCEKSFSEYIRYLETKNVLYFTRSRRLSMEK